MRKIRIFILYFGMCLCAAAPVRALDLNAFGEITLSDSNQTGRPSGFSLGQLDFWATQNLGGRKDFTAFLEFVVESPGSGFVIDLERLWVQYAATPDLDLRAGRMHTALGYWNRTYHHGAHMQTTINRPRFLDFEDGEAAVLPTHTVGLMGLLRFSLPESDVLLELQIGNGAYYNGEELDPNSAGDNDDTKALGARLRIAPRVWPGLGFGLSLHVNGLRQNQLNRDGAGIAVLNPDGERTFSERDWVDQTITGLELTYGDAFVSGGEFLAEYYVMQNETPAGVSHTATFWYVQAGKTIQDDLTPYARYESFENFNAGDPYFITLGTREYRLMLFGLRFNVDLITGATSALKFEIGFKKEQDILKDGPGISSESYGLQWTFGI